MRKKISITIIGIIITALFLLFTWNAVFNHFGILARINHIFYDSNLKIFHTMDKSDDVVIVDVDEKSLQQEGRWPWPRNKVATIVEKLQANGAAVIAFDVLFPEQESNIADIILNHAQKNNNPVIINYLSEASKSFNNDKIFADALVKSDAVLGVFFDKNLYKSIGKLGSPIFNLNDKLASLSVLRSPKYIGNTPVLADAVKFAGFTTTTPDEDGDLRRSPLLIEYNNALYPSLALETIKAYLLAEKFSLDLTDLKNEKIFLGVYLGNIYIPTDPIANVLINFCGPAFTFPYVSAADVLNDYFDRDSFSGKIVLIGASAVGIGDLHSIPLQSSGYPGTEVHANIISSILKNNIISSPLWLVGIERILIFTIGLIATILAMYMSALGLILSSIGIIGLIFVFNASLLTQHNLVLPHLFLPYLQMLFLTIINSSFGYLFETRQRKQLHSVYGQYVSTAHIDKMLKNPSKHTLAGHTKTMTVLFADVRSFTSISEKLDAKGVKKFLNELFTPLTKIIFEFKGTIDKYVGDMIMAFWNDPIDDPEHAMDCVQAALMMQKKVKELAPLFAQQNISNIGIRIGINTGIMHVGDMGSEYRKAYTVLGDAVNLASRLESVNKMYDTDILVSQETKEMCGKIIFRFIDCIYVKGKEKPTNIYQPLCLLSEKTKELETELVQYNKALELYKANKWKEAKDEFAKLAKQYTQIKVYDIYCQRANQYQNNPPPLDWDRGQHLTQK